MISFLEKSNSGLSRRKSIILSLGELPSVLIRIDSCFVVDFKIDTEFFVEIHSSFISLVFVSAKDFDSFV